MNMLFPYDLTPRRNDIDPDDDDDWDEDDEDLEDDDDSYFEPPYCRTFIENYSDAELNNRYIPKSRKGD